MQEFNPFDPAVAADPYPFYERLREDDPVHHIEFADIWAVSRYDDIVSVARSRGSRSISWLSRSSCAYCWVKVGDRRARIPAATSVP